MPTINSLGRSNLVDWLRVHLRKPGYAENYIKQVYESGLDGSPHYELSGRYTRTGNPTVYAFAPDELDQDEPDDITST